MVERAPAAWQAKAPGAPVSDELVSWPIIVYGAARSGTTYLVQILNRHPDVFVSNETRMFVWAHRCLNVLPGDQAVVYRRKEELVAHLREELPGLFRRFYRSLDPTARYWGDKNPHYAAPENAGTLDTIRELFPEARFIHITRDGRDVVASGLQGVWRDFEGVHRMWTSHIELGCDFGRAQSGGRYFELRYEDLVADDVAVARELFGFLGMELHPDVLGFCRAQREERTPFCEPARDLSHGASGSDWGRLLSPEDRLRSLDLLGEHLVRYGYETAASLARAKEELREKQDAGGA